MGDFNSIANMHEKKGRRVDPYIASARDFKDFILDTNLSNLGFVGHPLHGVIIGNVTTASLNG